MVKKRILCIVGLLSTQLAMPVGANELKEDFFSLHSPRKMHEMRLKIIESEDLDSYLEFFEFDPASFTKTVLSDAPEQMKLEYVRAILLKKEGWGENVSFLSPAMYGRISPHIISYLEASYRGEEFSHSEFEAPKRRADLWKRISGLAGIEIEEKENGKQQRQMSGPHSR